MLRQLARPLIKAGFVVKAGLGKNGHNGISPKLYFLANPHGLVKYVIIKNKALSLLTHWAGHKKFVSPTMLVLRYRRIGIAQDQAG